MEITVKEDINKKILYVYIVVLLLLTAGFSIVLKNNRDAVRDRDKIIARYRNAPKPIITNQSYNSNIDRLSDELDSMSEKINRMYEYNLEKYNSLRREKSKLKNDYYYLERTSSKYKKECNRYKEEYKNLRDTLFQCKMAYRKTLIQKNTLIGLKKNAGVIRLYIKKIDKFEYWFNRLITEMDNGNNS